MVKIDALTDTSSMASVQARSKAEKRRTDLQRDKVLSHRDKVIMARVPVVSHRPKLQVALYMSSNSCLSLKACI